MRLGQYEVIREIGRGGMGVVYEAVHPQLDKRVAIKVLHPRFAADVALVDRFVREGRAAVRARHPHLVDVTDVATSEGTPYLVMELLEGESLAARIARAAPMPVTDVVEILLPVCSAVGAAHAQQVLHRDLKPENVFLAQSGMGLHPKVLDFGIAKAPKLPPRAGVALYDSKPEEIVGTPFYMAPEQARGSGVDARADEYSIGIIAYECLTGRKPFAGTNAMAVLVAAATETPAHPSDLVPTVPRELGDVILRAMSRAADARFASVLALGTALVPFASSKTRTLWASAFGLATLPPPGAAPTSDGPRSAATIVVVEDEPDVRENLVELLEMEGFVVDAAPDGEEGLARIALIRPDLVLCDVHMPRVDGHELLRRLRADPALARTPFVFLTAKAERGAMRQGMNLGADDYLTKPYDRVELLDAIRTRLARHGRPTSSAPEIANAPTEILDPSET